MHGQDKLQYCALPSTYKHTANNIRNHAVNPKISMANILYWVEFPFKSDENFILLETFSKSY
jgi:hypothetical protein